MSKPMISFDSSDLSNWADKPEARHQLPQLLRWLVLATVSPERIEFPSGSSTDLSGWDGRLAVDTGNAWVPSGASAWELSVRKRPQQKADEDYEKRTKDPPGVDPSETTFVFVTLRRWQKKQDWLRKRRAEKRWRNVCAIDADDLAAWLDAAPSVAIRFAALISGRLPDGVTSLEEWWMNWANVTVPPLTPQLLVAGRGDQAGALASWASGPPQSFYVQANTRDEATAFLAASALSTADSWGDEVLARAVVVRNEDSWQILRHSSTPLILVRHFDQEVAAGIAVNAGHRVLTPLGPEQSPRGNGCELCRLGRDETLNALVGMGLSNVRSRSLMRSTGRQVGMMRRRLSADPGGEIPAWATPASSRVLVTLSLIGQWDESFDGTPPSTLPGDENVAINDAPPEGDRQIVEQITGRPYAEVEETVTDLALVPNTPVMRVGTKWQLTSHEEAWDLLAPRLTTNDIDRFEATAIEVLRAPSPEFDMPSSERYAAAVYGRTLRHSDTLRQGIMRALALMGARGDRATNIVSIASTVSRIASTILTGGADWRVWATLDRDLSTLAEAAPEEFLNAVEHVLALDPTPFRNLFAQHDGTPLSDTPHAGLLWALENIAWAEEHFSRVALILARLTVLAPDTASNHPRESLQSLFEPACRFTDATDAQRLETLETLLAKQSPIAWSVLVTIVRRPRGGIVLRDPPRWRPWGHDSPAQVTLAERQAFLKPLHELLLEHVGTDAQRWVDVVKIFTGLRRDVQRALIDRISHQTDTLRRHPNAATLRHELRTLLNLHRTHRDAAWTMGEDALAALDTVYKSLTPADPTVAVAWLFTDWPSLPDGNATSEGKPNFKQAVERIDAERLDAVSRVYDAGGIAEIERLCHTVERPYQVGTTFASVLDLSTVLDVITAHISTADPVMASFVSSALEQVGRNHGWPTLSEFLSHIRSLDPTPETIAAIYCAAPIESRVWRNLGSEPDPVQTAYWASINVRHLSPRDTAEADEAALRLLAVRRSWEIAWLTPDVTLSSNTIAQVLAQLPADYLPQIIADGHGHYVAEWLATLDQDETISDETIAGLEFPFSYALRHDRPELTLHRVVLTSPSFFAALVSWCFKRSDGRSDEPIDERERQIRGRNAFHLLEHLDGMPGLQPDGTVDGDVLSQWVTEARRLCQERGRGSIGDERIGQVLAASPVGADGVWPCEPVRDILDRIESRSMGRGILIGTRNRRDVTMRGVFEGGTQEYTLAERYQQDAALITSRWPFTARILRGLASAYEREGQHEDHDAKWRDLSE